MDKLSLKEVVAIRKLMRLTLKEILLILETLDKRYGFGYSKNPEVGKLQAKLSIMLEVAIKMEEKDVENH